VSDPASLDLLNDIVLPGAVAWWPPAPGWYVLAGLLSLLVLATGWRSWKRWRRNRYRRQALREWASMSSSADPEALARLPALLKRTALCAWPRSRVAALSGPEWHDFLDRTCGGHEFAAGAGQVLDRLAYGADGSDIPSDEDREVVLKAAGTWLRRHDSERKAA